MVPGEQHLLFKDHSNVPSSARYNIGIMGSVEHKIFLESNGKRRLKTPSQVEALEAFYAHYKYPSEVMKAKLAVELVLSEKQVHKWFCHRRQKEKRVKNADVSSGGKQHPKGGSKQDVDSGSEENGRQKVKRLSVIGLKHVGNRGTSGIMDYPTALLDLELRDQDALTGNHNTTENTRGGTSSSQERSSLQSASLCEMQSTTPLLQSQYPCEMLENRPSIKFGNSYKIEAKRRKKRGLDTAMEQTYLQEDAEAKAVSFVKNQLCRLFREDGPPLSIQFDPLPPGAFDTPIEPCHQDNPVSQDLQQMPKKRKMGSSYRVADLNSMQLDRDSANESPMTVFVTMGSRSWHKKIAAGRSGGKACFPLQFDTVPVEVGNMRREVCISRQQNNVDLHSDVEALGGNPDANPAMHYELHSQLHVSKGKDKVQTKRMTKKERLLEKKNMQREPMRALKQRHNLVREERRLERQRWMQANRKLSEAAKCHTVAQRANRKKQSKGSVKLMDDEQLELKELQIASSTLSFGDKVDEIGKQDASYYKALLGRFPPASLRMKQPLLACLWADSKENVRNFFLVFRFLYTFADVIDLCPFTLDEFVQAFHDHDSKLLGQIHIALLNILLKDIENELKSFIIADKSTRCALNDGSFLRIIHAVKSRGFDVKVWRKLLNPLTWPEILRQVTMEAGFCPKQKKEVQMHNKSVSKVESQIAPHGLISGTLKFALFDILSREGTTGLKISEMAKHVQKCDLNCPISSNELEPLICSTLSSDITLFEKISSSAFRLRANLILTREREQYHSCSESSGSLESDSEGSDTDETGESGYEEQDIVNARKTVRMGPNCAGATQTEPLVKEGKSSCEAMVEMRNKSSCMWKSGGVDRPYEGGTEIDESHAGEAWVLGLMEGEYADLSAEEKLTALVALVNLVNAGSSISSIIEGQPHRFGAEKGRKKISAARKHDYINSPVGTWKNCEESQMYAKTSNLEDQGQPYSKTLQTSHQSGPEPYPMESICLGSDRRHNKYWQFLGGCSLQDPGHGRVYFESSEDGHWEVIDNEEALDTLMALLDSRGIREANLLASLRSQEAFIRQEMGKTKAGLNQDMVCNGSDNARRELVIGDSPSGASVIENNQNGTILESENDSSDLVGAISVELGRTDVDKKHEGDRYRSFDKWVWSDFFRTLKVLKYKPNLLVFCETCHDLYWPDEEHCMVCHTTFELDFDLEERYTVHVARCKERDPDQKFQGHKVLSSRLQALKAGMQAVEAALPEEAIDIAWRRSGQKIWVKHLRRASSSNELAQVLTDLESAVHVDWLHAYGSTLSSKSTCIEMMPFLQSTPPTTAAIAFRLTKLDASVAINREQVRSKDTRRRRVCSKGKYAMS